METTGIAALAAGAVAGAAVIAEVGRRLPPGVQQAREVVPLAVGLLGYLGLRAARGDGIALASGVLAAAAMALVDSLLNRVGVNLY